MKIARLLLILALLSLLSPAQQTTTYIAHNLAPFHGPQAYRDPASGTIFYVESDGRHLAAISGNGKLLWNREPHKDAQVDNYRTDRPQIIYIGPARDVDARGVSKKQFIEITFNNSQFGTVKMSNGDFKFLGQD